MKKVFVPIDFSQTAFNALKYALQFTLQTGTDLILFYCHENKTGIFDNVIDDNFITLELEKKSKLKKEFEKALKELGLSKDYISCEFHVTLGVFVLEEIIEATKKFNADLVIMGTHGASGLKRVFMGSIASGMIDKSSTPVLAIPKDYSFQVINKIIYASDLANIQNEFTIIEPIAKALRATVEILYIDYGNLNLPSKSEIAELIKQLPYPKVKFVDRKVTINAAWIVYLKKYLRNSKESILAMFENEKSLFDKVFLISKTEDIVFNLPCPLLAMKKSNITSYKRIS